MARKKAAESLPLRAPRVGRPEGAKGIVVQLKPEGWKALKQLALDLDTSIQRLGVEAFNDLMTKHGRRRTIEGAWE
jgi:hypothetical protein